MYIRQDNYSWIVVVNKDIHTIVYKTQTYPEKKCIKHKVNSQLNGMSRFAFLYYNFHSFSW
jgi:hypothetical protein